MATRPVECKLYDKQTNLLTTVYITTTEATPEVMIWGDKVFTYVVHHELNYLVYRQVYAWWIPPTHK